MVACIARGKTLLFVGFLLVSTLMVVACSSSTSKSPSAPSTVAATPATEVAGGASTGVTVAGPAAYPPVLPDGQTVISFPPRDQPNAFFQELIAYYRDVLRRNPSVTFVDPEGQNVWLTEYFRFYLNGCTHTESVNRTLFEIQFGGTQPTCGFETPVFPPRNLPFDFQNQLEMTYRDVLRRGAIQSFVDSEGANVWLAQYLRFRTTGGCDHIQARNRVFTEIRGGGVQPDCSTTSTVSDVVDAFGYEGWEFTVAGSGTPTTVVTLTWGDPSVDLDLYLTSSTCNGYPPEECDILLASDSYSGTSEQISFVARGGDRFRLWIDNFTNRAQAYTLTATTSAGFSSTDHGIEFKFSPQPVHTGQKPAGAQKKR